MGKVGARTEKPPRSCTRGSTRAWIGFVKCRRFGLYSGKYLEDGETLFWAA